RNHRDRRQKLHIKIKINPKPAENNGTFDTLKSAFGKGGTGGRQLGSPDMKFGGKRFGGTVKGSSKNKSGGLGSRTRQRAVETGLIEEGDAAAGHETGFERKHPDK
ncbi:MAG: hypothetical protein VCG02_16015, partial [Verrucomicrobiota bacterium]